MAKSKLFDSVAHLDVIKTFNSNNKFFNENEKWYKDEINKTLKEIKKSKMAIEINTSGYTYPCKGLFPSLWIIKQAKKLNIPITIGTDCHFAHQIDFKLDDTIKLAKNIGYKNIVMFKKRKMIKVLI